VRALDRLIYPERRPRTRRIRSLAAWQWRTSGRRRRTRSFARLALIDQALGPENRPEGQGRCPPQSPRSESGHCGADPSQRVEQSRWALALGSCRAIIDLNSFVRIPTSRRTLFMGALVIRRRYPGRDFPPLRTSLCHEGAPCSSSWPVGWPRRCRGPGGTEALFRAGQYDECVQPRPEGDREWGWTSVLRALKVSANGAREVRRRAGLAGKTPCAIPVSGVVAAVGPRRLP